MEPIEAVNVSGVVPGGSARRRPLSNLPARQDAVELSNPAKAFARLQAFLNLGGTKRLDISELTETERQEFFKMLTNLLAQGVVGYEVLEVDGRPEKHYLVNQIGDQRLYGAQLSRRSRDSIE